MSHLPRIGIFVIRFPAPSETFIVTKVLGLLDAGFDVRIFTAGPSPSWDRFAVLAGRQDVHRRVYCAPPIRPLWKVFTVGLLQVFGKAFRHPVAFARFVRHHWRNRRYPQVGFWKGIYTRLHFVGHELDVLHVEFDTQAIGVIDLKEYLGCKVLLSSRGTFQKTRVLDQYPDAPRYLYRYVDGYHFISEYLRANTRRLGLADSVPTWLIEPAIDLKLFASIEERPVRASGAPLRVISVGRLAWQKGYEFAVDAIACVCAAGVPVEYTILGEGPDKEAAVFAARQWGLLEKGVVHFAGAVPREDVPRYLAQADVMLHAAVEEGFCNAVLEAQAAGLPIVTSDAGGLPENVADGVTGFVVPRRDPEAMARRLIELARDPELGRRMGAAGRERVFAKFDLSHQVEAFATLYAELVDQQGAVER
jgi:colanic acid/amylovoran biosynthesis glycosyltransferase